MVSKKSRDHVTDNGYFYCKAFKKIPDEIVSGENLHLEKYPDQKNDIVFEKKENFNTCG